jgi:hypothetical protein
LVPFQFQAYDWYGKEKAGASRLQKSRNRAGEEVFLEKTLRQVRRGGRMMLIADIRDQEMPTGRVTVVSTHLEDHTTPENRQKELEELLGVVKDTTGPVIVAGDMNTSTYDSTPTSLSREMKKRFGSKEYWIKESINYATGAGLVRKLSGTVTQFTRTYSDPTVRNVRFVSENHEAGFFDKLKDYRFSDGGSFDFRGESDRSAGGRSGTLANSNERASKGFVPSSEVTRPVGPVGKFKLDWIFIKPGALTDPDGKDQPHVFSPHFGRTLEALNKGIEGRISDHNPILVDLPFVEPR